MNNKAVISILVTIVTLVNVAFLFFWLPSFFADEFNYVYLTFSDGSLSMTSNPNDLFKKHVSRWTDISVTFRNNGQNECQVVLDSEKLKQSFNLGAGKEYGVILPKGEDINISFCGQQKTIRIN